MAMNIYIEPDGRSMSSSYKKKWEKNLIKTLG